MTLSTRMRWSGPPLALDSWLEEHEISAGRLGVVLASAGDLGVAFANLESCMCEFAGSVANVGGEGPGPGPILPAWQPTWTCPGRVTVLYAPSTGWIPRTLPNGTVVARQYWNQGIVIGGELVTSGVRFGPVTIDIDEEGGFPPQAVYALYTESVNYAIPQLACMRADGTYANGQGLFFQRQPIAGYPIGNTNDPDYIIPNFVYTLPNTINADPGAMNSPGQRSLKTGYAYLLFCQVDAGTEPDFSVYWGFPA